MEKSTAALLSKSQGPYQRVRRRASILAVGGGERRQNLEAAKCWREAARLSDCEKFKKDMLRYANEAETGSGLSFAEFTRAQIDELSQSR